MALVVILKLRSVLGRRTGNERPPYDPYSAADKKKGAPEAGPAQDKVVTLPRREREPTPAYHPEPAAQTAVETRIRQLASKDENLARGLAGLLQHDPSFDPEHFLQGAKTAYEMVVTAFAEGNKKLLKTLLAPDVYDGFVAAINDRETRGEIIDQSFVGINKADIIEVEMKGTSANVTVKFLSELISATRDRGGEVTAGDPKRIVEVTDIWTFARDVTSRNPNWKLMATQAAN